MFNIITDQGSIDRNEWTGLVESHPDGTVFQSPEMYDFFRQTENYEPVVVGAKDEAGRLTGILLAVTIREMKGWVGYFSARTIVYGGPLIQAYPGTNKHVQRTIGEKRKSGLPEAVSSFGDVTGTIAGMLVKALIRMVRRRSVFIQFRNFCDMSDYKEVFEKEGFQYRDRLNYVVDLVEGKIPVAVDNQYRQSPLKIDHRESTIDSLSLFTTLSKSRQRQIRKGLEAGARVGPAESKAEVRAFYNILHDLYRNKVKKPLPGWSFFENFYDRSSGGRLGEILVVRFDGKVIGGILCPVTPGRTIYEWYVCGLDQEHREAYPSVLATWGAMDYAARKNIPAFDFMGVGVPGRSYGVRDFKARFGGKQVNFGRFARINNRFIYLVAEVGYNLLAALKMI